MKFLKDKQTRHDFVTYAMCLVAFAIVFFMQSNHMIPRMIAGQLVPITAYIVMAISLNLVVGIAGDLSLGHAGFMSVGAYTGIVTAVALESAVPSDPMRLIISIVVGAIAAAILGFLIGIPVLRLSGDYLAIVTLAFGEIIKEIVTCLIVGVDSRGLHVIFNITGNSTIDDLHLLEDGDIAGHREHLDAELLFDLGRDRVQLLFAAGQQRQIGALGLFEAGDPYQPVLRIPAAMPAMVTISA